MYACLSSSYSLAFLQKTCEASLKDEKSPKDLARCVEMIKLQKAGVRKNRDFTLISSSFAGPLARDTPLRIFRQAIDPGDLARGDPSARTRGRTRRSSVGGSKERETLPRAS